MKRFGIDLKMVTPNAPAGFPLRPSPEGRLVDEWGVVYQRHEEAQTHFVVEQEAPLRQIARKKRSKSTRGRIPRIPPVIEG